MRTIQPIPARIQTIDVENTNPNEYVEITHNLNTDGVLIDVYTKSNDNKFYQITHHVEVALTRTKLYVKTGYRNFRVVVTG